MARIVGLVARDAVARGGREARRSPSTSRVTASARGCPASALARPFDAGAYATEPSPHADVTLASASAGLVRQLEAIGEPVVLVGHSLFGHVIGAAAERAPALVERLVYVCAVMAGSGADAGGYVQSAENEGEQVGALVVADPGVVGAVRLDVRSPDEDYRAALRARALRRRAPRTSPTAPSGCSRAICPSGSRAARPR